MADRPGPGVSARYPLDAASDIVPSWLTNLAALSWRVLVILLFGIVAWLVAELLWTVTASIAVGIVIAAVLAPFVLRLRANGRSRNAAAGIVWAAALAVALGFVVVLALAFLPFAVDLVDGLRDGMAAAEAEAAASEVPAWVAQLVANIITAVEGTAGDAVGGIVASAASAVTILILAAFLVFFLLRDGDKAWLWFFQSLGAEKRERITTAGDEALGRVGGYLRGTTVLALIIAATNYLFMLVLGVPLAIPLAILSFVATYIPYFGSLVATIIIAVVALGALGVGPTIVLLVLMGIRGGAISYFIRPAIYGRTVSLHPALVLIVLPLGLQLGGVVGLFAAVPITAVVLTVAQAVLAIIEPVPAPPLPALVPAWLDRAAQWSWRALLAVALIGAVVIILISVPLVVLPLLLALIFAATLDPLVLWLEGRGHARGRASAMAVFGSTLVVVGVLALALGSLVVQATELSGTINAGAAAVDEAADGHFGLAVDAIETGSAAALQAVLSVGRELASLAVVILLAILLTFYFLRDGSRVWGAVTERVRPSVVEDLDAAGSRAFGALGGYMIGTGAISVVGAGSQAVIMVVLGLPLALPIFVLGVFLGYIPYIGGFIATALGFLVAVAVGDTSDIVIMFIWTIVFNLVQGNIVAPLVYGRTVHIHPAVALLAIPAGSAVAGIFGMFIVVPAIGVVSATWRTLLLVVGSDDDATGTGGAAGIVPEEATADGATGDGDGDDDDAVTDAAGAS